MNILLQSGWKLKKNAEAKIFNKNKRTKKQSFAGNLEYRQKNIIKWKHLDIIFIENTLLSKRHLIILSDMRVWAVQPGWNKAATCSSGHMIRLVCKATVHEFFSTPDFCSSQSLINQALILFGICKWTLSVIITKSRTSNLSGVAAERWLAYCVSSWKPKLIWSLQTTHLQINWPKYEAASPGRDIGCWLERVERLNARLISGDNAGSKDLSMSRSQIEGENKPLMSDFYTAYWMN